MNDICEDCFRCQDCKTLVCHHRPYCEHQVVCDACYPSPYCGACTDQLESEGALA